MRLKSLVHVLKKTENKDKIQIDQLNAKMWFYQKENDFVFVLSRSQSFDIIMEEARKCKTLAASAMENLSFTWFLCLHRNSKNLVDKGEIALGRAKNIALARE